MNEKGEGFIMITEKISVFTEHGQELSAQPYTKWVVSLRNVPVGEIRMVDDGYAYFPFGAEKVGSTFPTPFSCLESLAS